VTSKDKLPATWEKPGSVAFRDCAGGEVAELLEEARNGVGDDVDVTAGDGTIVIAPARPYHRPASFHTQLQGGPRVFRLE
jgi:hypothetical protein